MSDVPAVPLRPLEEAPYGVVPRDADSPDVYRELIAHAFRGVELGSHDRLILEWLGRTLDQPTTVTLCPLIERARNAEREGADER